MAKATVVLDEQQQAELEMLLEDKDANEALRFLKEVIWQQIQAARKRGLRSHLEHSA